MHERIQFHSSIAACGLALLCAGPAHAQGDRYLEVKLNIAMRGAEMAHSAVVESGKEATVYVKSASGSASKLQYVVDDRGPLGKHKETVGLKGSLYVPDQATGDWQLLRKFEMVVAKNRTGTLQSTSENGSDAERVSISFSAKGVDEKDVMAR